MRQDKGRFSSRLRAWAATAAVAVLLSAGRPARGTALTWDSGGAHPTVPADGSGTWDLSTSDWSNGTTDQIWPNDATIAIFGDSHGAAGTVNLAVPINTGGLVFNASGSGNYTLTGAALNLSAGTIAVNGTNPTISASITGPNGLIVSGTGSLTLTGPASLSVPSPSYETVNNGTLQIVASSGSAPSLETGIDNTGYFSTSSVGTPSGIVQINGEFFNSPTAVATFNTSTTITGFVLVSGTITIAKGQTLQGLSDAEFNDSEGTLNINGTLSYNQFVYDGGGTIKGSVFLTGPNPNLDFGGSSVATGTFNIATNSSTATLNVLNIPSGVIINFEPSVTSTLKGPSSMVNNASLNLISAAGFADAISFNLLNNGNFSTSASGTPSAASAMLGLNNNTGAIAAFNTSTNFSGNVVNLGTINLNANLVLPSSKNLFNQSAGTVTIAANASLTVAGQLAINGGAIYLPQVKVVNPGVVSLVQAGTLSFGGASNHWVGQLDLGSGALDIQSGNLAAVTNQVQQGYAGGTWQGSGGIDSSAAADDSAHLTAMGVIQNNQSGSAIFGAGSGQMLFDGITPGASDILARYTYYGDTNLDGKVDGSDYSRIDNGYLQHSTGWFNGDFSYDGVINGSDYTLIDNAFNTQGASLAAGVISATAQVTGSPAAVPEPAAVGILMVGAMGLGRRRRIGASDLSNGSDPVNSRPPRTRSSVG